MIQIRFRKEKTQLLTVSEVTKKIKAFAKISPSDLFDEDPRYREYFAICSRLLKLDFELTALNEQDRDEYFYIKLNEINDEVETLTKKKL